MKWTDTDENADTSGKTSDLYFEEETDNDWEETNDQSPGSQKANSKVFFLLIGLVIVAAVAVFLVFLLQGGTDTGLRSRIAALEERISLLEEKVDRFEAIDQKVTRIWEQAKSFEKFKARFDRTEASMSLRMDHLTMSLEALQKKVSRMERKQVVPGAAKPKGEKPKTTKPSLLKYHQVKAGETLFSISRRYGLTVEQLLKMNKMKTGDVIKPGQKLIVNSSSKQ